VVISAPRKKKRNGYEKKKENIPDKVIIRLAVVFAAT